MRNARSPNENHLIQRSRYRRSLWSKLFFQNLESAQQLAKAVGQFRIMN